MAELPIGDDWKEGDENDICCMQNCFCPNCEGSNGDTNMLPTKVPFFREIIIMAFVCNDCHYRNSEINFGGEIQVRGERIQFTITCIDDLNRQIIKSDSATVTIPNCDLEIPPNTQRGNISTIEGFLKVAASNLESLQPERLKLGDIDNFHRCRTVISKLRRFAGDPISDNDDDNDDDETKKDIPFEPFVIIVDDPAGNSFIENPYAPDPDPNMKSTKYYRTPTQDMSLGLQPSAQAIAEGTIDDTNPKHKNIVNSATPEIDSHGITTTTTLDDRMSSEQLGIGRKEVIMFETPCASCYRTVETNMCVVDIPHFKEIIIMSMVCEHCGYKSNEIKGGGGIPKYGTRITLHVTSIDDMSREILKSDTAGIQIPELELELEEGGLDGVYTTIEGLLQKLYDRLTSANPFSVGDSATKQHLSNDGGNEFSQPAPSHMKYQTFLQTLKSMSTGTTFPFTIIITDPLSNSFIGPIANDAILLALQAERDGNNSCYDNYVDPGMTIAEFTRTFDQNEILGLNDIKTENYHDTTTNDEHGDGHSNKDTVTRQYYGTDTMEELPDRIRRIDIRGPDHPHDVGKAPVDDDTTVMGPGSLNFAVPSIGQRGTKQQQEGNISANNTDEDVNTLQQFLQTVEKEDTTFQQVSTQNATAAVSTTPVSDQGMKMVLKTGAQGFGYYTDIPLHERWSATSQR